MDEPRTPGQYVGTAWCRMLRGAASAQGVTRDQIHEMSGIYRPKVVQIFAGRTLPSADEALRLCGPLRLSPLLVLDALGHLPGASNIVAHVDQLEEQVQNIEVKRAGLATHSPDAAATIAGPAIASGRFRVSVSPVWIQVAEERLHYADFIALDPTDGKTPTRRSLEELLGDELAWCGAGFLGIPESARGERTPDLSTVINVPRFVAPRRSSGRPLNGAPRSVCVIGGHWSGSADVASFLGYGLDYDYAHVGFVASRAYSRLSHQWDHELFDHDRREVARTYTVGSDLGRPRVWAVGGEGNVDCAELLLQERRQHSPFIVYLRVSDQLIRWTSALRVRWHHTDDSLERDTANSEEEREACDRIFSTPELARRCLTIDVGLPPGRDPADVEKETGNDFYTQWYEASEQALQVLAREGRAFDVQAATAAMRRPLVPSAD